MRFHSMAMTVIAPISRKDDEGENVAFVHCAERDRNGESRYVIAYFGKAADEIPDEAEIGSMFVATGSVIGHKNGKYGAFVLLRGETYEPMDERRHRS